MVGSPAGGPVSTRHAVVCMSRMSQYRQSGAYSGTNTTRPSWRLPGQSGVRPQNATVRGSSQRNLATPRSLHCSNQGGKRHRISNDTAVLPRRRGPNKDCAPPRKGLCQDVNADQSVAVAPFPGCGDAKEWPIPSPTSKCVAAAERQSSIRSDCLSRARPSTGFVKSRVAALSRRAGSEQPTEQFAQQAANKSAYAVYVVGRYVAGCRMYAVSIKSRIHDCLYPPITSLVAGCCGWCCLMWLLDVVSWLMGEVCSLFHWCISALLAGLWLLCFGQGGC